jgi:hypothetical protein
MGKTVAYKRRINLGDRAKKLTDPFKVLSFILNHFFPRFLWNRYLKQCDSINQTAFLLSFDCDTELDIQVLPGVIAKLNKIGIKPVLAVPGELIEKGKTVYKKLSEEGIEFINHGYVQHTHLELPQRRYHSSFFYHELSNSDIREDIRLGHNAIFEHLGVVPLGFRTPHFGSYQKKSQLRFLWECLGELGYEFSSSTTPIVGIRKGPLIKGRILELPVTGCPSWPIKVLDSWNFGFAPDRSVQKEDYLSEVRRIVADIRLGRKVVVNIYADPSQVYDWPEFFEALQKLAAYNVGNFKDLIDIIGTE